MVLQSGRPRFKNNVPTTNPAYGFPGIHTTALLTARVVIRGNISLVSGARDIGIERYTNQYAMEMI
jgi:hypothetical protein